MGRSTEWPQASNSFLWTAISGATVTASTHAILALVCSRYTLPYRITCPNVPGSSSLPLFSERFIKAPQVILSVKRLPYVIFCIVLSVNNLHVVLPTILNSPLFESVFVLVVNALNGFSLLYARICLAALETIRLSFRFYQALVDKHFTYQSSAPTSNSRILLVQ